MGRLFLTIFVVSGMGWNLLINQKNYERLKTELKTVKKGADGKLRLL